MDALHLPRLHASSILPAWRRAWRRKPADLPSDRSCGGCVPLPAALSIALPSPRTPASAVRLAVPQVVHMVDDRPRPPVQQPVRPVERRTTDARLSVRQDPADARRVRLAGSMAEVCAALDRLVLWQESEPR